jgi:TolB-like protein
VGHVTTDDKTDPVAEVAIPPPPAHNIWERLKHHKVMHWTLAYAAAAYTLLHGVEMLSDAQEWPHVIVKVLSLVLVLGVPVVMTLAWYHGAKGLQRVSGPELAIITVLLLIAGSVLWALTRSSSEQPNVASALSTFAATPDAAISAAPRTAIAVMPFNNTTGDPSKDYLGDGMAEALIDSLGKVAGLKIPARTSSFAYKGRNVPATQIAQDLKVGAILDGSVRGAGDRIRISAQLSDARDGFRIWGDTYDEKFTDVFKLQDKIATAIVRALQQNLNTTLAAPIGQKPPTQDVETYQLYLQAFTILDRPTLQNTERALDLLQQAVARDPKFARAYGLLADAHYELFNNLGQPFEHLAKAEQLARQALALDPNIPEAHDILGVTSANRGRWLEMEKQDQIQLALDSTDAQTIWKRAAHLSFAGRLRESLVLLQKAYALAPASAHVAVIGGRTHSTSGLDNEALRYANLASDLGFPKSLLVDVYARAALRAGRYAEAGDLIAAALPADPDSVRAGEIVKLAYAALADPGKRSAALAARTRLYPERGKSVPTNSALALNACMTSVHSYVLLAALDAAYELIDQCLNRQPPKAAVPGVAAETVWSPEMRPFRMDPRFQALAKRIGLMEYWQQFGAPDDCDLKDNKLTCH